MIIGNVTLPMLTTMIMLAIERTSYFGLKLNLIEALINDYSIASADANSMFFYTSLAGVVASFVIGLMSHGLIKTCGLRAGLILGLGSIITGHWLTHLSNPKIVMAGFFIVTAFAPYLKVLITFYLMNNTKKANTQEVFYVSSVTTNIVAVFGQLAISMLALKFGGKHCFYYLSIYILISMATLYGIFRYTERRPSEDLCKEIKCESGSCHRDVRIPFYRRALYCLVAVTPMMLFYVVEYMVFGFLPLWYKKFEVATMLGYPCSISLLQTVNPVSVVLFTSIILKIKNKINLEKYNSFCVSVIFLIFGIAGPLYYLKYERSLGYTSYASSAFMIFVTALIEISLFIPINEYLKEIIEPEYHTYIFSLLTLSNIPSLFLAGTINSSIEIGDPTAIIKICIFAGMLIIAVLQIGRYMYKKDLEKYHV